jgi:hypothetical protein
LVAYCAINHTFERNFEFRHPLKRMLGLKKSRQLLAVDPCKNGFTHISCRDFHAVFMVNPRR